MRPWGHKLYKKMTKEKRQKLMKKLKKKGKLLVRVYTDKHGKRRVLET